MMKKKIEIVFMMGLICFLGFHEKSEAFFFCCFYGGRTAIDCVKLKALWMAQIKIQTFGDFKNK